MANPAEYESALFDYAGNSIAQIVRYCLAPDRPLLDIGAGWGKYRWLLPEYEMDAVEIWGPYIKEHRLDAYYRRVYNLGATEFAYPERYGAVIMGDVLEHMRIDEAQAVVDAACKNADHVLIATPFEMPQDEVDNNPHEAHVQDDLTREKMAERYPQLTLCGTRGKRGEHTKALYRKAR